MSLRNPKPWEICIHTKSLTGVHIWNIEHVLVYNENTGRIKNKEAKVPTVLCKACRQQPPNNMRGRIRKDLEDLIEQNKRVQEMARLYHVPRKRRR